ncbi:hypothetical protein AAZX31_14G040700 [Glycine max]
MASLMQEAYVSCRKGWGKTIVLGVDKPGSKLNLSCSEVHVCGKSLRGCLFGGLKPKSHVPILLRRYMDKGPPVIFPTILGHEAIGGERRGGCY